MTGYLSLFPCRLSGHHGEGSNGVYGVGLQSAEGSDLQLYFPYKSTSKIVPNIL